eukprot:2469205-Prymnesium_polylepis.1
MFGRRQRQLLAGAGARLTKPKLVACFKQWFHDWDVVEKERIALSHESEKSKQEREHLALSEQVRSLKSELSAARKEVMEGKSSKEGLQAEMVAQLEVEREKRVEQLGQQGMRRIMQKELAMGWQAWHDMH